MRCACSNSFKKFALLKRVGASGQISLGKKYAGQLFDVVFYPDGWVEMAPVKVVSTIQGYPSDSPLSATQPHSVQQEAAVY